MLGGDDGDFSLTTFEGRGTLFRDVHEVLSTVAMFGGGKRLAVVEDADDFVTRYRAQLEDYVGQAEPQAACWCSTWTRCPATRGSTSRSPPRVADRLRRPPPAQLSKWLADWAKQHHHVQLPQAAGRDAGRT